MKRPLRGLAVLGTSALLLTACATDEGGSSDGEAPIRFAIVYGLTGAFAGTGEVFMKGFNAAVEDINANGGVNGQQIEVELLDSKSDPTHGVSVLTELLDSGYEPDVIVPGGVSSEVLAMLPLASDVPAFTIAPATSPKTNDPAAYPYHFGVSATQAAGLAIIGDTFKKEQVKTLAVVLPADAFGDSVLAGVVEVAKEAGVEIVQTERPDPTALSFSVEFQRVQTAKPDAVFFDFAAHDATSRLLEARQTVGATDIPAYGGAGTAAAVPSKLVKGSALENCELPVFNFTVQQDSPPKHLRPLLEAFEGSEQGIYSGGLGYDTVRIAALALERSDDDTGAETLAGALTGEGVPENYLSLFPTGTRYTDDDHFPELQPGNMTFVPCNATLANGLWVTEK